MNKCKILFLAANPAGTSPLALDHESREIDQKINAAEHRDALELITKWAGRPDDLLQYLNQYRPDVVHFSGHGSETDQILLMDDARKAKPVSAAALKRLFTTLKDNIRVVVLNACYSKPQALAIVEVIDCAIGMKREIGDEAAITFAAAFYRAIGFGRSVQEAFDQGIAALMLEDIPEEDTPALLVRPGVDPKALFLFEERESAQIDTRTAHDTSDSQDSDLAGESDDFHEHLHESHVSMHSATLNEILPGNWHVQIQTPVPGVTGELRLAIFANGFFKGELKTTLGTSVVDGQWQADPVSNRFALQGRQMSPFQVVPYTVVIQLTYFDSQQLVGVTTGGEQVAWQRLDQPAAAPPVFAPHPKTTNAGKRPKPMGGAAAAPRPAATGGALKTWRERLDLHQQEAIIADPAQKFSLKKQIEEAQTRVRELGG